MTPNDWAAFAVAITSLIGALALGVRHLVKHYLSELRPNGGSSVKDQVNRLEEKVEFLTELMKQIIIK
jgi:H+/Cl- antiporter ClcA